MSVNINQTIVPRMWRGYTDPGLPIGAWIASAFVIGDATGGNSQLSFVFKAGGEPSSGRFFNLEQVDVFKNTATAENVSLQAQNFDRIRPPFVTSIRRWRYRLELDGDGAAAIDISQSIATPLFLGQVARLASERTEVTVQANNTDGVTLFGTIQGYIWEARSILSEGGLRRPVEALYGR